MEFIPTRSVKNPVKYVEQPYVRVDIEAKDHTNIYNNPITAWNATGSPTKKALYGYYGIGLEQSSSSSSNPPLIAPIVFL
jgi:hypothetical protein